MMNTIANDAINFVVNAARAIIIVRIDETNVHVDVMIGLIGMCTYCVIDVDY